MYIADINLNMPLSNFEKAFQEAINSYPETMTYTVTPTTTKRGKSMYKVVVSNDKKATFTLIAEQDANSGDIMFRPLIMQSIDNSFYQAHYPDPGIIGKPKDPAVFACTAMSTIATSEKGTFAYYEPVTQRKVIIHNGRSKPVRSIALVDDDGNVFACSGAKKIKGDTEDTGFSIVQPIGEWLEEHDDLKKAVASLPSWSKKMDCIGKWLIQARIREDIDSDEFMDIFRQAGVIGFSDSSVMNIYKLIM